MKINTPQWLYHKDLAPEGKLYGPGDICEDGAGWVDTPDKFQEAENPLDFLAPAPAPAPEPAPMADIFSSGPAVSALNRLAKADLIALAKKQGLEVDDSLSILAIRRLVKAHMETK
jgi:hypothetical protein